MNRIRGIQPIVDAASLLKDLDNLPNDQKLRLVKQELFKGRAAEKIKTEEVFNEIHRELQLVMGGLYQLMNSSKLRDQTIQELKELQKFTEGFKEADVTLLNKVRQTFTEVITSVEGIEVVKDVNLENIGVGENFIEQLRLISNKMQEASNYDEILENIHQAEELKLWMERASTPIKLRADNFYLLIQAKVNSFINKELDKMKAQSSDSEQLSELRGRLKKYEILAHHAGFQKRHLLDIIDDLRRILN